MFQVATIEDKAVRIAPHNLALTLLEALTQQIEATYVDKVVPELGLVVTLYDIAKVEGGEVFPAEGAALYTVVFSVVVFRPFEGEVITGRVKNCDASGVQVSLGFFDDVHIPANLLQEPSTFDAEEKLWKWENDGTEFFMEIDDEIRFRVHSVRFPTRPKSAEELSCLRPDEGGMPGPTFAPMVVLGDTNSEKGLGLGSLSWWSGGEGADEEMQEGAAAAGATEQP